ncbi:hypothetical protein BCR42DRAFT_418800 [Absidia repens]|uniref:BZIP domain-containing protein n=1 Tax=Absidia repens TaxID=90262 RepID=A0A1X2IC27_9FUNG|nr:hypothetical protein BCR42DRAFT_418800 [Absidia repens]
MVNDQTQDNIANTSIDPKSVLVENSANTIDGAASQQPSESQHVYAQQVTNSPPMAVLPLNPSAKLDQEPNPFEQSFSSASKTSPGSEKSKLPPGTNTTAATTTTTASSTTASTGSVKHDCRLYFQPTTNESLKLPPVAAMTSPAGTTVMSSVPKDIASQYAWDSLRAGPLSPSMLQRPTNPDDYAYSNIAPSSSLLSYPEYPPNSYQSKNEPYYPHERTQSVPKYQDKQQPSPPQKSNKRSATNKKNTSNNTKATTPVSPVSPSRGRKLQIDNHHDNDDGEDDGDDMDDDDSGKVVKKSRTGEDDEKRKNFLERNRLAALKCRQRKKQWLNNLQAKVEYLTNDNEQLQIQTNSLRDEIMNLKTLLLAHKDCPISQANNGLPTNMNSKTMGTQPPPPSQQQQPSLLHSTGGSNAASTVSSVPTTATMAPMYTQRPFNNQSSPVNHPHHHQQRQHQHRLSTSSTGSQPPSGALNMVMVSQHQVTAPQSSTVSSSSGVMQF